MSGRGRGRGRGDFFGSGSEDRRPLRRPGDGPPAAGGDQHATRMGQGIPSEGSANPLPPQQQCAIADRIQEMQKLAVSAEPTEDEIVAVLQDTPNDAELSTVMRDLHEKALVSQSVAISLASACGRLQAEAAEGSHLRNLRTHLLNFVQSDFTRRHDDRVMEPARFVGACWLLCEVFRSVRLADGSVVRVLGAPILEYLTALLHCRPEDQITAAAQLCRVGGELYICDPEAVSDLINSIRERLTSPDCSPALRPDLLLCVELAASGWSRLSQHARHFYSHHGVSLPPDTSAGRPAAAAAANSRTGAAHRSTSADGPPEQGKAPVKVDTKAKVDTKGKVDSMPWVGKPLPVDDWDD